MNILVGMETLLLALLTVLVAGLLRSNAEILRQLGSKSHEDQAGPSLNRDSEVVIEAQDLVGVDLYGVPVEVDVSSPHTKFLLAFLSSGCLTCEGFWKSIRDDGPPVLPGDPRLVIVTKNPDEENLARLRELGGGIEVPVVMSSAAWVAYSAEVSPFFSLVDGSFGTVVGECAAESWKQVLSLASDAIADTQARMVRVGGQTGVAPPSWKEEEVTAVLAASGVPPGHPSLYDDRWSEDQVIADEGGENHK